jgi:hypothetical protein
MARGANAGNAGRGSHWIRDEKRRRIYERDGWRCVWCTAYVATSGQLAGPLDARARAADLRLATLDHVLPRSRGGSNHESNLITCCSECNERRGDTCAIDFAFSVGASSATAACVTLDRLIDAMAHELPPRKARAA